METITVEEMAQDLKAIRKDLDFIKQQLIDPDRILSQEDKLVVAEAREEYAKGETTSLEDLEKEIQEG